MNHKENKYIDVYGFIKKNKKNQLCSSSFTHLYKSISKVTSSVHHRQVAPCHNFGLQLPRHDLILS